MRRGHKVHFLRLDAAVGRDYKNERERGRRRGRETRLGCARVARRLAIGQSRGIRHTPWALFTFHIGARLCISAWWVPGRALCPATGRRAQHTCGRSPCEMHIPVLPLGCHGHARSILLIQQGRHGPEVGAMTAAGQAEHIVGGRFRLIRGGRSPF